MKKVLLAIVVVVPALVVAAGLLSVRARHLDAQTVRNQFVLQEAAHPVQVASAPSANLPPVRELPEDQRLLLTGEGGLDSASYFNCTLTNASSWTVTELRVWIAAGRAEGSTRWERTYTEYLLLPPGSVRCLSFKVTDGRDVESIWRITGARGRPSR